MSSSPGGPPDHPCRLPADDRRGGPHVAVAVVTGAGQGLGRAIATRLAGDGHRVAVVDVDGVKGKAAADAIGGDAYECDVTDRAAVRALAGQIGPAQILV